MGMPVSLHLRGADLDAAAVDAVVGSVFGLLEEADRVFSTYRDHSEISRIRRGELALDEAGPLVRQVHRWCERAAVLTDGAFTPWLPDAAGVVRFDPTGLVKGWAAERAARWLTRSQPHAFCLNVGGDVVVDSRHDASNLSGSVADAVGSGPVEAAGEMAPWRVGIEDPADRSRIACSLDVHRGGVATSGSAARGAHLYEPVSREFVDRPGSVTVSGPSLMWADVWATAAFVGPVGIERLLAERAPGYRLIRL
jgi:thiamine biosynthesis lipoprotein